MLNFLRIAVQLRDDGHYKMAAMIEIHGEDMAALDRVVNDNYATSAQFTIAALKACSGNSDISAE